MSENVVVEYTHSGARDVLLPPAIRFTETRDGVRIAYCKDGSGPPLVFVRGWVGHLELLWDVPSFRAYFEAIGRHFSVIRYDVRGNGLSDHEVSDLSLDGLVLDLEAVVEALGLKEFVLYGSTFGTLIAAIYAARHPECVSKVILDGGYERGHDLASREQQKALISMLRTMPEPATHVLSVLTTPGDQSHEDRARRLRRSISNSVAVQLYSLGYEVDISGAASRIMSPTLVLHRRGSRSIPFEQGRRLASRIPGARFVALDGREQNPWEGDTRPGLAAIGEFLGVPIQPPEPAFEAGASVPLTILFTDMEDSSAITERIGDREAQKLIRLHDAMIREALREHGGTEIKHTGDGLMASFVSASKAIECACAIQDAFDVHNRQATTERMRVRVALNAGEPVTAGGDLFGTSVNLAARILGETRPGEVVVANVVRELVAGKGFRFVPRGQFVPRGFTEPVGLYEVERGPAS